MNPHIVDQLINQSLSWPEKPTCHNNGMATRFGETRWATRPDDPYRHCSFCGSLHPEDLLTILNTEGSGMGGSDWKYGFPHKFYVYAKNPRKGQTVEIGIRSGGGQKTEIIYGAAPASITLKWYTAHFKDEGLSDAALAMIFEYVTRFSGIEWRKNESGVWYNSPYFGFQQERYHSQVFHSDTDDTDGHDGNDDQNATETDSEAAKNVATETEEQTNGRV